MDSRSYLIIPDERHRFIGGKHQQYVSGSSGFRNFNRVESLTDGQVPVFIIPISNHNLYATVTQVQCLCTSLIPVTQYGNRFAVQSLQGDVIILE